MNHNVMFREIMNDSIQEMVVLVVDEFDQTAKIAANLRVQNFFIDATVLSPKAFASTHFVQ